MRDPTRVGAFLDVFGPWDPSLAVVLAGAVVTSFLGVRLARRLKRPVLPDAYDLPTNHRIDARLVGGAVIFGVDWRLSRLCPGPAVADLVLGLAPTLVFVAAMLVGMVTFQVLAPRLKTRP